MSAHDAANRKKHALIRTIVFASLSFLFTLLVLLADVAPAGPAGTCIGLSHMNLAAHEIIGEHLMWYNITKGIGALAIVTALLFACAGAIQLIRRKSLYKVDRAIFFLGIIFLIVIAVYLFFEVVIVNYRPVIMPGESEAEASFPSSHTMLACVIFGCAIPAYRRLSADRKRVAAVTCLCILLMIVMVIGRLLSGVHWLSDIIAACFISMTLISLYDFFLQFR